MVWTHSRHGCCLASVTSTTTMPVGYRTVLSSLSPIHFQDACTSLSSPLMNRKLLIQIPHLLIQNPLQPFGFPLHAGVDRRPSLLALTKLFGIL